MAFELPDLPFDTSALEPVIDAGTMQLHHRKHHAGYVSKLNDAVSGTRLEHYPIEDLMRQIGEVPDDMRESVRNFGGGHFNHSLFWRTLRPPNGRSEPVGDLVGAIEDAFGGTEPFQESFKQAATSRFGSGWAWLCANPDGGLHIRTTPNQDVTFYPSAMNGDGADHTPILGLDLWEHAYYLRYHNNRGEYIDAWWNVVNWDVVAENYARARESQNMLTA